MARVSAIVLAAGLSSRMQGRQKLFLPYRNNTILEQVVTELLDSKASEVIIVSSPLTHDQIKAMSFACQPAGKGITLVTNPDHKLGMTTTIQKGVEAASPATDGFMICLGDMPRIITMEYDKLLDRFSEKHRENPKSILLPFYQGQKGNPVIFSSFYREAILTHTDMEGCRGIVQANSAHLTKVEMQNDHVLVDVDTPGDYERLPDL
ncbi:MAG: nucleotidyltransferase family protein [Cyclobacteriaceae bacterium]